MKTLKGIIKSVLFNTYYLFYRGNVLYVDYRVYKNNFGDLINKMLLEELSGLKVVRVESDYFNHEHILAIGSVLGNARSQSIVWGSGFISDEIYPNIMPKRVLAVRGKLSRDKLLSQKIQCPEIYGDPALLLPLVYNPKRIIKFKYGIIPHYIDKDSKWIEKFKSENEGVKVIDIQQKRPLNFIDDILSCEMIFSSSLHGIIVADAYGIPNAWIKLSDKLIGDEFKFKDYFSSIEKKQTPVNIVRGTNLDEILNCVHYGNLKISTSELLNAAPFKVLDKYLA